MTDDAAGLREGLEGVPLLHDLPAPTLEALAAGMRLVRLTAGDLLVRQDDEGDEIFVILRGDLEAFREEPGRPDQVLTLLGPGDVVGELAVRAGGRRTASVRARTAATLGAVHRATLEVLFRGDPELALRLTELSARRLRRSQLADYLARRFGAIEPSVIDDVEREATWVALAAGDVLFHQGDPGDALYILLSGRLRVVHDEGTPGERVLADVGRGETVGEIALVTHAERSATVYAVRDSHLARLSHAAFTRLTGRYPAAMLQITRLLGVRLQQTSAGAERVRAGSLSLALVPCRPDVALHGLAGALVDALETIGPTALLTRASVEAALGGSIPSEGSQGVDGLRLAQWIDEQETQRRYLVYVADPEWSAWTARAVQQADRVLLVADATADPDPGPLERRLLAGWSASRSPHLTLVLLHPPGTGAPRDTARWRVARRVDDHVHVRAGAAGDIGRLARIVSGNAVGLVLGGGGARGFAHVGVLRACEELGIPVDMIGGTSSGAIFAAMPAMGLGAAEILEQSAEPFRAVLDLTPPIVSLAAGGRVTRSIRAFFGDRQIEDLWLPYFCMAANLTRADQVVQDDGPLADAIRATVSLPGVFPPVYRDGDLLVDGGLLNNLPIDTMRARNPSGAVLAVDVSPAVDLTASAPFGPAVSGWRLAGRRLNPRARGGDPPGILDVLQRSLVLGSVYLRGQLKRQHLADLVLHPPVGEWGLFDYASQRAIAERGYESSRDELAAWWSGRAADDPGA